MASGEPTPEVTGKMTTILSVVEWAGVPEALAQAFFGAIGAARREHPRILGVVSSEEMDESMKGSQLTDKPLTIVQKGLVPTLLPQRRKLKDQLDEVAGRAARDLFQQACLGQPAGTPEASHLTSVRGGSPPHLSERPF